MNSMKGSFTLKRSRNFGREKKSTNSVKNMTKFSQWSYSVDATSNDGLTIPESFDGSSRKPKKMNTTKKKNTEEDKDCS